MRTSKFTRFLSLEALALCAFLSGCATHSPVPSITPVVGMSGSVHGGQQPISGATIQLYTPKPDNLGGGSTPLLAASVLSDANGNFNISGLYTCPSPSSLVYLTATGGNPGSGGTNPQIALMATIGPCGALTPSTFISINEITTVAAVSALTGYMRSYSDVYYGISDVTGTALANAFAYSGYIATTTTGATPGLNVPAGLSVPIAQVNTVADLLAACINSPGGVSGDSSVCGQFFKLANPSGPASTDTVSALVNLALSPASNTAALFSLIPASSPFQPIDSVVPPDLAIRLLSNSPFTISPSSLTFAPAIVYSSQPTQTITVTNGTSSPVAVTSASFTGANASDFGIGLGTTCGSAIPANSTCTYQISFLPTVAGARTAYFVLANSSPNPSIAVALSGTSLAGVPGAVTLTPAAVSFPPTNVGASSSMDFILANSGNIAYPITSISNGNSTFSLTNHCSSQLPAPGSCTITLTFSPSVTGTQYDSLAVQYTDNTATPNKSLFSFITAVATAPDLQFSPSSLAFPATAVGTAAGATTVSLYNKGTIPLSNLTALFSGAGASSFSETNNCPPTLAVSAFCVFTINAAPAQTGAISASLTVSTSGSSGTLAMSVTGTAGSPTNNAMVLSDSQHYVPSSGSSVITLTNTGVGPIDLGLIYTSIGFSQTNTCGSRLAAAATCNVQLSAAAVAANSGPVTGALMVSSNAQTLVQTVALYTAGTVQDFGQVVIGYPAASPWGQYANYGQVYTSGPNAGDFPAAGDNGGCGRVGPCIVYTQFVPQAVGQRIAYSTNSGLVTLMVGTGVPASGQVTSYSISAAYISFGTFVAGLTNPQPQTVTLTNTGNLPVPINSIATSSSFFLGYQFPETNTCGSSLAVGATCTITVSFLNTMGGGGSYDTGLLTINTYSLTPIVNIPLSANPLVPQPGFTFSSTSVTLAPTQAGTASTAQTVTMSNTGNTPLIVTAGPYSSGGSVFTYATTCGTVSVGGACTITVNGTPPSAGTFTGVLPVSISAFSGSVNQNISVAVTGS